MQCQTRSWHLVKINLAQPIITAMGGAVSRDRPNQSTVRLDRQNPYLRIDAVNVFVRD